MSFSYPMLLDGGLSNQLEKQGHDLNHQLWSAHLLEHQIEAIIEAHLTYLEAGAHCIITSSYQASIHGFFKLNYTKSEAIALISKSVQAAEKAVQKYSIRYPKKQKPLIAASVGAYGAYLADGSEYRGDYEVTNEVLRQFHQDRLQLLDQSNVDILACETIPSFQEAKVLSGLLLDCQTPAWISFSCQNGNQLHDGTPIKKVAEFLSQHPNIFAIGVNCTPPKYVSSLIKLLKKSVGDKKIVVYPNSGETYHASTKQWSEVAVNGFCTASVKEWLDLGADIVGGCCRVDAATIQHVNESLFLKR